MPCVDRKVVAASPSQQTAIHGDPRTDPETITSITSKYMCVLSRDGCQGDVTEIWDAMPRAILNLYFFNSGVGILPK